MDKPTLESGTLQTTSTFVKRISLDILRFDYEFEFGYEYDFFFNAHVHRQSINRLSVNSNCTVKCDVAETKKESKSKSKSETDHRLVTIKCVQLHNWFRLGLLQRTPYHCKPF